MEARKRCILLLEGKGGGKFGAAPSARPGKFCRLPAKQKREFPPSKSSKYWHSPCDQFSGDNVFVDAQLWD